MKKPDDNLESFSIDKYHDWAIVVNERGANVYMINGENWKYSTTLDRIGHLDCGTVCFIEEWRVCGDLGYMYKSFTSKGNIIGFIRWKDIDFYDRFVDSKNYYEYMTEMKIENPYGYSVYQ